MPRERRVGGDVLQDPSTGDLYYFPNEPATRPLRDKFVKHTGAKPQPLYDGREYKPE